MKRVVSERRDSACLAVCMLIVFAMAAIIDWRLKGVIRAGFDWTAFHSAFLSGALFGSGCAALMAGRATEFSAGCLASGVYALMIGAGAVLFGSGMNLAPVEQRGYFAAAATWGIASAEAAVAALFFVYLPARQLRAARKPAAPNVAAAEGGAEQG